MGTKKKTKFWLETDTKLNGNGRKKLNEWKSRCALHEMQTCMN
jgi:hypothetical protein